MKKVMIGWLRSPSLQTHARKLGPCLRLYEDVTGHVLLAGAEVLSVMACFVRLILRGLLL
jgi:hypothetical protein